MLRYTNFLCLSLLLVLLLSSCQSESKAERVNASDYDSFWLWAGVKPQPVLVRAKSVYILEGEVRASDSSTLVPLRPGIPEIKHADLWMVVRVENLDWSPGLYNAILVKLDQWSANGNNVTGLQIDFDANTVALDQYAKFLRGLRQQLPRKYKLGITGLLDWSANGDPAALASLSGVIDEAVFQVYQGRSTITGYEKWLKNLDDLPMPFRIGLVQGGEWKPPASLPQNPNFRGYVVFLINQPIAAATIN